MSETADVVEVNVTAQDVAPVKAGFNLALILSGTAAWDERTREYGSIGAVLDDWDPLSPEGLQAAKVFGQNPRPPKLLIGRSALPPTQRYAITPLAVNGHVYTGKLNETLFTTAAADGSATVAEVVALLKTAIDALSDAGIATTVNHTTYLEVVAASAGLFNTLYSDDPNLHIAQDHADPGVATDLANIALERNDWYGLITSFNSKAYVEGASLWAEAARKFYVPQLSDWAIPNTAISGTDDTGESLKSLGYHQTTVIQSKVQDDFAGAAWIGRVFPINPGEETWMFKQLTGVPTGSYTATQITNMKAKNVNFYDPILGVPMTQPGKAASGRFSDLVRYIDFLRARIGERIFLRLAQANKVAFDDGGISMIVGEVEGQLASDEARRVLLPGWSVVAPKATDVTSQDRADRILGDIVASCVYSGAIHKVRVNLTISV